MLHQICYNFNFYQILYYTHFYKCNILHIFSKTLHICIIGHTLLQMTKSGSTLKSRESSRPATSGDKMVNNNNRITSYFRIMPQTVLNIFDLTACV